MHGDKWPADEFKLTFKHLLLCSEEMKMCFRHDTWDAGVHHGSAIARGTATMQFNVRTAQRDPKGQLRLLPQAASKGRRIAGNHEKRSNRNQ
jgi:hypothetical protein